MYDFRCRKNCCHFMCPLTHRSVQVKDLAMVDTCIENGAMIAVQQHVPNMERNGQSKLCVRVASVECVRGIIPTNTNRNHEINNNMWNSSAGSGSWSNKESMLLSPYTLANGRYHTHIHVKIRIKEQTKLYCERARFCPYSVSFDCIIAKSYTNKSDHQSRRHRTHFWIQAFLSFFFSSFVPALGIIMQIMQKWPSRARAPIEKH